MAENDVSEKIQKLRKLQDILAGINETEKTIEELPKNLTAQKELTERLKKEFIEKNAIYEEVRQKVAKLRTDLAEADAQREKSEKGMDNITSHREYEALDKEIRDATELEQQIRKELQKEEKNLTELNENLKADEQLINSNEAELNAQEESINKQLESLKNDLAKLKKQKDQQTPGIDPEIIYKFERIIKSKQGKGIVSVKGNSKNKDKDKVVVKVCDGCHMVLPAQFANLVQQGDSILFCPYCSRILYYEETNDEEDYAFDIGDTPSLDDDEEDEDYLLGDEEEQENMESDVGGLSDF